MTKTSKETTYGRAAKIVAIYLKCTVVLAGHHMTQFASVLHPPIDRILLTRIAAGIPRVAKICRKSLTWTRLDEDSYFELIGALREVVAGEPFWSLERHWRPVAARNSG